MTRLRLGCTLLLVLSSLSCHLPSAADLTICKHATLSAHLSGPAVLSHSVDLKQFTLDFGVISGAQEQVVWTLDNPGQLEVTVLKVIDTLDPAWNVDIQQGQTIPANGHLDLKVTFIPPTTGPFTHSLSIVTDACLLSSVGLTLTGTKVRVPALVPSDSLVKFGLVASREYQSVDVTLRNVSNVDLTVKTGSVEGPQAAAFTSYNSADMSSTLIVLAHENAQLTIGFKPGDNLTGSLQHYSAQLNVSYCNDGCSIVLQLEGDSYECLSVQPQSIVFDGGPISVPAQQGLYFNFNNVQLNNNALCTNPIAVGIQAEFLNQLPDGGPADGGPFSLDPWVVDGGLSVYYYNGAGLAVTFSPTDNLAHSGTLNLTYEDPIFYALTIPMAGHISCLTLTNLPYFSAFADGPKDAMTQSVTFQNRCSETKVTLSAAPIVPNFLPDGGKLLDGPFSAGPGAAMAGAVVMPGASLDIPVVYAPTENTYQSGSDLGGIELATDEPYDSPTTVAFYGQGLGPNLYFQNSLDFTSSWGTTQTRSTYLVNYAGDFPPHVPTILGIGSDCPGMDAGLEVGVPALVAGGSYLALDATWTVPSCDGGECGCDGGYCNCTIYLMTSDIPPPVPTLPVYY